MKVMQDIHSQFWKHVHKTETCWFWTGAKFKSGGYGAIKVGGRKGPVLRAHRLSWELRNGRIPDGLWVLHHCDTPACVNPDHLFLGNNADNMRDCSNKGRMVQQKPGWSHRGEKHWHTKLKDDDIRAIRSLIGVVPYRKIAEQFGVSSSTIYDIGIKKVWAHVA